MEAVDPFDEWKRLRKELEENKLLGTITIAKNLISRYKIKTIGNRDNTKDIYLYTGGVYTIDHGLIKKEIIRITGGIGSSHVREEILKAIKEETWEERRFFEVDKNFINLKNGIYNIRTKEFLPHNPDYRVLHQIPVVYDKNVDCLKIKEFLNQILDEESVKVIQEWFGYCLYRSYFIKKAIIFLGEKDTGKTTLLKVKGKFLGWENTSGVSLQKISSDKFALYNLFQKHANIYDDLSFKDINDNGTFKMLTGGGPTTGEKKFGDQFQFTNHAKLTFSCNKIPNIDDTDDDAYFSRWIIVRFEHPTDKPDKFLFEKITTDAEMSGLLNFALEGLDRLLENQNFSYHKTPEEIRKEMSMSASSLAQFAYGELISIPDPDIYLTKDNVYQEFINYASKNDLPVMSKEAFGKALPNFITVGNGRKSLLNKETGKMKQFECWLGLEFRDFCLQPLLDKVTTVMEDPFDFGP